MGESIFSFIISYGICTFLASQPTLMAQIGALRSTSRLVAEKAARSIENGSSGVDGDGSQVSTNIKNTKKSRSSADECTDSSSDLNNQLEKTVTVRKDVDTAVDSKPVLDNGGN